MKFFDKLRWRILYPHKTPVTTPIEGYTLKKYCKNVIITAKNTIPSDIRVGNRVVFLEDNWNPDNIPVLAVPQRKIVGYLRKGKIYRLVDEYRRNHGEIVSRVCFLSSKPYSMAKLDIAFFEKQM